MLDDSLSSGSEPDDCTFAGMEIEAVPNASTTDASGSDDAGGSGGEWEDSPAGSAIDDVILTSRFEEGKIYVAETTNAIAPQSQQGVMCVFRDPETSSFEKCIWDSETNAWVVRVSETQWEQEHADFTEVEIEFDVSTNQEWAKLHDVDANIVWFVHSKNRA